MGKDLMTIENDMLSYKQALVFIKKGIKRQTGIIKQPHFSIEDECMQRLKNSLRHLIDNEKSLKDRYFKESDLSGSPIVYVTKYKL